MTNEQIPTKGIEILLHVMKLQRIIILAVIKTYHQFDKTINFDQK